MAWDVDKNPIEYLEQRVKYYKKKKRDFKNFLKDEKMIERFGKERIEDGMEQVELRILEFEYAVLVLKTRRNFDIKTIQE